MTTDTRKQIRRATIVFWVLLIYILAALVWWFVSLEKQNRAIQSHKQAIAQLKEWETQAGLINELALIRTEAKRNSAKYIGEGIAFLILIVIGAAFIYRSVRRQFKMQQQQQNFMMAVTHELKTPISVARLNLETMQKYQLEPERQKKMMRMTLDEIARLNSLTNNILVSSQLEQGRFTGSMEELDLSDLLKDCMMDFRNRFPDRKFSFTAEPDIDIKGDAVLLQLLINNLVENAIKYSPKETEVKAGLKRSKSGIELMITDEGAGIPDSEKKKIFTRFYRIGNETTRKTQGTGLGLYLCKTIAGYHNADILVTDNKPHGSSFAVVFYN